MSPSGCSRSASCCARSGATAPRAATRTLDAHASRLRRKLTEAGAVGYVVNRRGVGYRFVDRAPAVIDQGGPSRATANGSGSPGPGVRRRKRLRRTKPLERRTELTRSARLVRRTPLRRKPFSPASEEQCAKVAGQGCLVCGRRPVDPAHLVPRSLGGCDDPDCVVPLCRPHHRAYDLGRLDLLPHLEPRWRPELAHALLHIGLFRLLRRVTGTRWVAVDASDERRAA